MNSFMINVVIDNMKYAGNVTLDGNLLIISYGNKEMNISKNSVDAIKIISDNLLEIVVDERIITFDGSNIVNIISFFDKYKIYNNSNIRVNPVRIISVKTPFGLCIIFTLLYIIIYDGLIGVTLKDVWGTGVVSSFLGSALGGRGEYYPTDKLELMSYSMLLFFFICSGVSISKRKNKAVTLLQTQNNFSNDEFSSVNNSNLDTLGKLKELLDAGVITQEDFDNKKSEILKKL